MGRTAKTSPHFLLCAPFNSAVEFLVQHPHNRLGNNASDAVFRKHTVHRLNAIAKKTVNLVKHNPPIGIGVCDTMLTVYKTLRKTMFLMFYFLLQSAATF